MSNTVQAGIRKYFDCAIRVLEITKSFGPTVRLGKPDFKSINLVLTTIFGESKFRVGHKNVYSTGPADRTLFQNFSVDIERGTVVGLVGPSGSGKTILLKLMSGVQPINAGRIEIRGSVASLLNLGENMEPGWTLQENVEQFGRLLAMLDQQIRDLSAAAIEFAELSNFTDIPIRFFSTGMQMRLSVAMVLLSGAEILLIDDVLQVGDLAFQKKCITQLRKLKSEKTTVVLVMQDELLLNEIADRVLRFNCGKIISDEQLALNGPAVDWCAPADRFKWHMSSFAAENDFVKVLSVKPDIIERENAVDLRFAFACEVEKKQYFRPFIDVRKGNVLLLRSLYNENITLEQNSTKTMQFSLDLPISTFAAGTFIIDLGFLSEENGKSHSLKTRGMLTLEVGSSGTFDESGKKAAAIHPELEWSISPIEEAAS